MTIDLFSGEEEPYPLNKHHARYLVWREENPIVLKIVKDHCLRLIEKKKRFGLRLVINQIRFNEYFEDYTDGQYRISNNHTPYLARELIKEAPEIKNLITIHRVQGEKEAQAEMEEGEE